MIVLIIGAGSLGSVCSEILARNGFDLKIIDRDIVEKKNLRTQLFTPADIGKPKVVGLRKLKEYGTRIQLVADEFNDVTAQDFINDVDIVVDCSDNIETKILVNDVCVKLQKPFVFGSVLGEKFMVASFYKKPCLRCILGKVKLPLETCETFGVSTVVVFMASALQAEEVMFYSKFGKVRKKFIYGDVNGFKVVKYEQDPNCNVCIHKKFTKTYSKYSKICDGYIIRESLDMEKVKRLKNFVVSVRGGMIKLYFKEKEIHVFPHRVIIKNVSSVKDAKKIFSELFG